MFADLGGQDWTPQLPPDCRLAAWQPGFSEAVAAVIYEANLGTRDAQIIPELRSLVDVQTIVTQTVQGRYGVFDPEASSVVQTAEGAVVAGTLATRRRTGQGFTAEICVLPAYRRQGLARALLTQSHRAFVQHGLNEAMLGVTVGNPALHLYERLGYMRRGSVWTYVWPRPEGWDALNG